jgi:hypothetical protein
MTECLPERVTVHPFTDVDGQIDAFCTTFADFQKDFDSGLSVTIALVLSRTASSIDMIGMSIYLSHSMLSHVSMQYVTKF